MQRVSGSRSVVSRRSRRLIEADTHAREQLLGHEGLREVVIGSGVERRDAALEVGTTGEKEDGDVPPFGHGPHDPDRVPPVDLGQHRVEQHEVGLRVVQGLHEVGRVVRGAHHDALRLEDGRDAGGEVGVVVDHEHAHLLVATEREHLLDRRAEAVRLHGLRQVERGARVRGRDPSLDIAPLGKKRHGHTLEAGNRSQLVREGDGLRT